MKQRIILLTILYGLLCLPSHSLQAQTPLIHTDVTFTVYPLNPLTSAVLEGSVPCSVANGNITLFGCTAIAGSSVYTYPYNSSTITLDIEKEYLPNVVSKEMFPPEFHPEALKSQAISARTYAYYQINNPAGEFNNSTSKQVFIPHQFQVAGIDGVTDNDYNVNASLFNPCSTPSTLLTRSQIKVCDAVATKVYLSDATSTTPINAEFFADFVDGAIPEERTQPFIDPISSDTPVCRATIKGHGRGMSQKGASRWAFGNRCSAGNDQDPWSVRYDSASQILHHYYPKTNLRQTKSSLLPLYGTLRWNPLKIDSPLIGGFVQSGSQYPMTINLQNTGTTDWTCANGVAYELGYEWLSAGGLVATSPRVPVCGINAGQTTTANLTINDIPATPGSYTLALNVYKVTNGVALPFNFVSNWRPYSLSVVVNGGVCPPSNGSCASRTPIDLVFVVDTTGSMSGGIASVQASMTAVLSTLQASHADYRIAVVEFRDFPQDTGIATDFPARTTLNLTNNQSAITTAINGLSASGGGSTWAETTYSGLMMALGLPWRSNAVKSIILFTDAPPLDPEPHTSYTAQSVITAARSPRSNGKVLGQSLKRPRQHRGSPLIP